jgi:hypothetical protein
MFNDVALGPSKRLIAKDLAEDAQNMGGNEDFGRHGMYCLRSLAALWVGSGRIYRYLIAMHFKDP